MKMQDNMTKRWSYLIKWYRSIQIRRNHVWLRTGSRRLIILIDNNETNISPPLKKGTDMRHGRISGDFLSPLCKGGRYAPWAHIGGFSQALVVLGGFHFTYH